MEAGAFPNQEQHGGISSGRSMHFQGSTAAAMVSPSVSQMMSPLRRNETSSSAMPFGPSFIPPHGFHDIRTSPRPLHMAMSNHSDSSSPHNGIHQERSEEEMLGADDVSDSLFNYQGDALSPEHPRNFKITPVIEEGKAFYYCHLCSYCGSDEESLSHHLENHFEHRCAKCDYTSRTEGRLKQHIQRFHNTEQSELAGLGDGSVPLLPGDAGHQMDAAPSRPTRTPVRRKVHRCKQCEFTCMNKNDFWAHARTHIKEDKILQCPKCQFVTEYKHHLEYHLRNHFGSKPYKCQKCNYTCVNKSMLNSHMKSHTSIYQYRCATCTYATKYCHSLKLHLKKYDHTPASILNLDGTVEHDTSSLLTMKRSGPKSAKVKAEKKLERDKPHTQTSLVPQPITPHSFPPPPPSSGMLPFWSPAAFGDMPRAPPPLVPLAMNPLFRGLLPSPNAIKQAKSSPETCTSATTFLNAPKCDECGLIVNSQEQLAQHKAARHNHNPGMLGFFGSMGSERLHNGMMWPRPADMLKAAMSLAPFSQSNPMNMVGGFLRPPQPSFPFIKEGPQTPFNGGSTAPATCTRSISSTSSVGSLPTQQTEAPLDLTKPIKIEQSQPKEPQFCNRMRSRKGKALKLDALCLRLQEKVNPEHEEIGERVPALHSDGSSPNSVCQLSNRYPSPTESGEGMSSDHSHQNLKVNDESNNNNNSISLNSPGKGLIDKRTHSPETNNNRDVSDEAILDMEEDKCSEKYKCVHCDIIFGDCAMYTMHMGYHGYLKPFICNMCGEECADKVAFFCHIARAGHP